MSEIRKLNLRLPPELHGEAVELAGYMGVSLNGLCMMALRNWIAYQNRNRRMPALQGTTVEPRRATVASREPTGINNPAAKVGPNAPCPCGSGQKYKRCHGIPGRS